MTGRALNGNRRLRLAMFGALYAAQGIPDAMVLIVFPAFLATHGASISEIGVFLATAMLPNAAKLVVGPLIDRFAFLPMGRRKPWLMVGQIGIATSFAALALLDDPMRQIGLFTAGAFAITLATVFQDVATDATAMDLIPSDEQGRTNGIMWGAKTLGTAGAASVGAWILFMYGFAAMTGVAAAALLAITCLLIVVRERPGERLLPWSHGAAAIHATSDRLDDWKAILRLLIGALRRPAAMRLVVLSLAIGLIAGMTGALAPVLIVKQLDWAQADYAQFRATLKLVSGAVGMLIGGFAIDRMGHQRVLVATLSAIALASLLLALFMGNAGATAYFIAYEMLIVFAFITFFAATMSQCGRAIAATQFSFTMVCGNITMSLGAALMGPVMAAGGSTAMLIVIAGVASAGAGVMIGWRPDTARLPL
jgi:PAT family beta-lactamase induction signal transducer AmpG